MGSGKFTSSILSVLIMLAASLLVLQVTDTVDAATYGDFEYDLLDYDTGVQITAYNGPGGVVTIPDTIDGKPVMSIGDDAFCTCDSLTSITMPDSVTSIGTEAFGFCYALTSITMPDNLTSIGDFAFYDCYALTSITMPDNVTSIGTYAFTFCHELTSITMPDNVTSIGEYTFYTCDSLTSITMPDNLTSIGGSAFAKCDSLTSITMPDNLTSIGGSAFAYCSALTSITFLGDAPTVGTDWAYNAPLTVYYYEGATGFTTPTWQGKACVEILDISGATIQFAGEHTYTGEPIMPDLSVSLDDVTLVEGTDYTVAYQDNINVGTAIVTVTGKGKYYGTNTVQFIITPKEIVITPDSKTKVFGEDDPALTYAMSEDVDITGTLTRAVGDNVGTYVITIGTLVAVNNNYVLTLSAPTVTFEIVADLPGVPVVTAVAGDGQATLSWTAPNDGGSAIVRYLIYQDGVIVGNTTETTYTITGLTNEAEYEFQVAAENAAGEGAKSVAYSSIPTNIAGGGDGGITVLLAAVAGISMAVMLAAFVFLRRNK